jgi:putative ATP-binding cassette transporter
MLDAVLLPLRRHQALRRFWKSARGFCCGPMTGLSWGLIALLITVTVLQILVQYRLDLWNRDFFNALEFCNGGEIGRQTQLLLLAALSIGLAVMPEWGRMTFQRSWRGWVSRRTFDRLEPAGQSGE